MHNNNYKYYFHCFTKKEIDLYNNDRLYLSGFVLNQINVKYIEEYMNRFNYPERYLILWYGNVNSPYSNCIRFISLAELFELANEFNFNESNKQLQKDKLNKRYFTTGKHYEGHRYTYRKSSYQKNNSRNIARLLEYKNEYSRIKNKYIRDNKHYVESTDWDRKFCRHGNSWKDNSTRAKQYLEKKKNGGNVAYSRPREATEEDLYADFI